MNVSNNASTNAAVTFFVNGKAFTAERRVETRYWSADGRKKARAYVWGATEPDMKALEELANTQGLDSPYTTRGDDPVMDKAWSKFNREIVKNQRQVLNAALSAFDNHPVKVTFSIHAGCGSCPCSPGFVLSGLGVGVEYFINPVKVELQVDAPDGEEKAA